MNEAIEFIEKQLDYACRFRHDRCLVTTFKHNAYGACLFVVCQLIRNGKSEEADELDKLWDNKYRIHFEALENSAS